MLTAAPAKAVARACLQSSNVQLPPDFGSALEQTSGNQSEGIGT